MDVDGPVLWRLPMGRMRKTRIWISFRVIFSASRTAPPVSATSSSAPGRSANAGQGVLNTNPHRDGVFTAIDPRKREPPDRMPPINRESTLSAKGNLRAASRGGNHVSATVAQAVLHRCRVGRLPGRAVGFFETGG